MTGVTLSEVEWPGDWDRKARCRTAPTVMFFAGRGDSTDQAKRICALCPVVEACAEYAIPHSMLKGVWGGLSEQERKALRAARAAAAAAVPAVPDEPTSSHAEAGTLYRQLEDLAGHPGQWARICHYRAADSAGAIASLLRTGQRPVPPGVWTFEGRIGDAGGSDLYARVEVVATEGAA